MILSDQFRRPAHAMRVYIRPEAAEKLLRAIGWGKYTPDNRTEQGGILAGYFYDAAPENEPPEVYVEVCHIIPCDHPQISEGAYLYMSSDDWRDMLDALERFKAQNHTDMGLVGWYHTHPGDLPTAFSDIDIETHSKKFTYEYGVGLVLNPHRKKWTVYYSPRCREGQGFMMLPEQDKHFDEDLRSLEGKIKNTRGESPVSDRPETDDRVSDRIQPENPGQIQIDEWRWWRMAFSGWPERRYILDEIRPAGSRQYVQDMCSIVRQCMKELEIYGRIDQQLSGMMLTAGLATGLASYTGLKLLGKYYYHRTGELETGDGDAVGEKLGVLVHQRVPDKFRSVQWLGQLMRWWRLDYLMLCRTGRDGGYVFHGFIRR